MPDYTVRDNQTGKTIKFRWNGPDPPTDADYEEIFAEARTTAKPAASEQPSALSRFGSALLEQINPVTQVQNLYQQVRHPIESANQRLQYQAEHPLMAAAAQQLGVFAPGGVEAGARIGSGDVAGGFGQAAGAIANAAVPVAIEKGAAAVGRVTNNPRLVNPNPTERAAIAESRAAGIPVPAGAATGNRFVQAVQSAADNTPLGSMVEARARQTEANALRARGQTLAAEAHPEPATAESAGQGVLSGVRDTIRLLDTQADEAYGKLRAIEQGHEVTVPKQESASVQRDIRTRQQQSLGMVPSPKELEELRRIHAEMDSLRYVRRTWTEAPRKSGNAAGGDYDITPGAAGAPVYDDILAGLPSATYRPTRSDVTRSIQSALDTGQFTPTARAALEVAKQRIAGSKDVAAPSLPPDAGLARTTEQMLLPVDLRDFKTEVKPFYDRLHRESELVPLQGDKARALTALDRLVNGPDYAPVTTVDAALSDLKAMARGASMPELRSTGQGLAAGTVARLDARLRAAVAKAGPQATEALETGRAATTAKYAVGEILDSIASSGPEAEPVKAFKTMTAARDTNIALVRRIAEAAPAQIPVVGRAVLEGLLDKATAEGGFIRAPGLLEDWNRLGPQTKQLLYGPELTQRIDRFLLTAKRLSESPNPSRTALTGTAVGSAMWIFTNPLTGVPVTLGAGALSKILRSPKAVDFLTSGLELNAGPGRFSRAAQGVAFGNLQRAARAAGVELPKAADQSADQPTPAAIGR